jgi:hypothetical protein
MYKLIKTKITGFDDREDIPIGVNPNYKTTMGYNDTTETISVKVEKIIRSDLTRDDVEVSYQTVDEKTFIKADFVQSKDNMSWTVDFDVVTEKILSPFDVHSYTSTIATGSLFHRVMWRKVKERYSTEKLLPLFVLDSFYKEAAGFSLSTLQFLISDIDDITSVSDTILTNTGVEEMTQEEKIAYHNAKITTHVFYEIFDSNDNLISSIINASAHPQQALAIRPNSNRSGQYAQLAKATGGDQYRVSLPNSSEYKIRVLFYGGHLDKTASATFNVSTINAQSNKDRLISGIKSNGVTTNADVDRIYPTGNSRFAGSETLKLALNLDSGDYAKLKLSVGDFYSWSELWIDII